MRWRCCRKAQAAVGKSTLGLCCMKEGLSGYKGCKVYSLSIVLFIISYLNSYFITYCVTGPFSFRPTKTFALPYTSLLPPSPQEQNTLIPLFPSHRPLETFTLSPSDLHSYNCVTTILLIFTFIFSY